MPKSDRISQRREQEKARNRGTSNRNAVAGSGMGTGMPAPSMPNPGLISGMLGTGAPSIAPMPMSPKVGPQMPPTQMATGFTKAMQPPIGGGMQFPPGIVDQTKYPPLEGLGNQMPYPPPQIGQMPMDELGGNQKMSPNNNPKKRPPSGFGFLGMY